MAYQKRLSSTLFERWAQRVIIDDNCWLWEGSKNQFGYGMMTFKRQRYSAHRLAFELFCEPIPADLELDHICRNPSCVNPAHLETVTHRENMYRGTLPQINNWGPCVHGVSHKSRCRVCRRLYNTAYVRAMRQRKRKARLNAWQPTLE